MLAFERAEDGFIRARVHSNRAVTAFLMAGVPYKYVSTVPNDDSLDLEPTHYDMKLTEEEFDAAGGVLANTLDHFDVPEKEKNEVLGAFTAHKDEVISGTIK